MDPTIDTLITAAPSSHVDFTSGSDEGTEAFSPPEENLEFENESLVSLVEQQQQSIAALRQRASAAEREKRSLRDELALLREALAASDEQVEEMAARVEEIEGELESLEKAGRRGKEEEAESAGSDWSAGREGDEKNGEMGERERSKDRLLDAVGEVDHCTKAGEESESESERGRERARETAGADTQWGGTRPTPCMERGLVEGWREEEGEQKEVVSPPLPPHQYARGNEETKYRGCSSAACRSAAKGARGFHGAIVGGSKADELTGGYPGSQTGSQRSEQQCGQSGGRSEEQAGGQEEEGVLCDRHRGPAREHCRERYRQHDGRREAQAGQEEDGFCCDRHRGLDTERHRGLTRERSWEYDCRREAQAGGVGGVQEESGFRDEHGHRPLVGERYRENDGHKEGQAGVNVEDGLGYGHCHGDGHHHHGPFARERFQEYDGHTCREECCAAPRLHVPKQPMNQRLPNQLLPDQSLLSQRLPNQILPSQRLPDQQGRGLARMCSGISSSSSRGTLEMEERGEGVARGESCERGGSRMRSFGYSHSYSDCLKSGNGGEMTPRGSYTAVSQCGLEMPQNFYPHHSHHSYDAHQPRHLRHLHQLQPRSQHRCQCAGSLPPLDSARSSTVPSEFLHHSHASSPSVTPVCSAVTTPRHASRSVVTTPRHASRCVSSPGSSSPFHTPGSTAGSAASFSTHENNRRLPSHSSALHSPRCYVPCTPAGGAIVCPQESLHPHHCQHGYLQFCPQQQQEFQQQQQQHLQQQVQFQQQDLPQQQQQPGAQSYSVVVSSSPAYATTAVSAAPMPPSVHTASLSAAAGAGGVGVEVLPGSVGGGAPGTLVRTVSGGFGTVAVTPSLPPPPPPPSLPSGSTVSSLHSTVSSLHSACTLSLPSPVCPLPAVTAANQGNPASSGIFSDSNSPVDPATVEVPVSAVYSMLLKHQQLLQLLLVRDSLLASSPAAAAAASAAAAALAPATVTPSTVTPAAVVAAAIPGWVRGEEVEGCEEGEGHRKDGGMGREGSEEEGIEGYSNSSSSGGSSSHGSGSTGSSSSGSSSGASGEKELQLLREAETATAERKEGSLGEARGNTLGKLKGMERGEGEGSLRNRFSNVAPVDTDDVSSRGLQCLVSHPTRNQGIVAGSGNHGDAAAAAAGAAAGAAAAGANAAGATVTTGYLPPLGVTRGLAHGAMGGRGGGAAAVAAAGPGAAAAAGTGATVTTSYLPPLGVSRSVAHGGTGGRGGGGFGVGEDRRGSGVSRDTSSSGLWAVPFCVGAAGGVAAVGCLWLATLAASKKGW